MKKKLKVAESDVKIPLSAKNLLRDTRCYLVGGMQYVRDGRSWRDKVKAELSVCNITFFDPYHKPFIHDIPENESSRAEMLHWMDTEQYDLVQQRMWDVRGYDLRLCDISDFFIVHLNPMEPTIGTIEEIITAVREKKPVFLSIEGSKKKCPLWLMGVVPHKYIYDNIDDIISTIKAIDAGIIKMNSARWKLLNEYLR